MTNFSLLHIFLKGSYVNSTHLGAHALLPVLFAGFLGFKVVLAHDAPHEFASSCNPNTRGYAFLH